VFLLYNKRTFWLQLQEVLRRAILKGIGIEKTWKKVPSEARKQMLQRYLNQSVVCRLWWECCQKLFLTWMSKTICNLVLCFFFIELRSSFESPRLQNTSSIRYFSKCFSMPRSVWLAQMVKAIATPTHVRCTYCSAVSLHDSGNHFVKQSYSQNVYNVAYRSM